MPDIEELERSLQPPDDARYGAPDLARIRQEGARLRRRRQLAVGGAGLALAACVTTTALVVPGMLRDEARQPARPDPADVATSPSGLVDACRDGENSTETTSLVFGGGDPTVKSMATTRHRVSLALESADGRYWADCFVSLDNQEFRAGMTVYPVQGTATDFSSYAGPGCGLVDGEVDADCHTFATGFVDRRPPEVVAAQVTTGDGETTTIRSRDGFLVFEHLGRLPEGVETDEMGLPTDFVAIRRVVFLDSDAQPIAAQAMDGTGDGPDGERIGDLPTLTAFPALRGDPVY